MKYKPDTHNCENNNHSPEASLSPISRFLLEMGPLVVFFLANYKGEWLIKNVSIFKNFGKPIFPATAIFMVAIVIALSISWIVTRKLPLMPLISGFFVLIFGFLTLWLRNDIFIKVKPTIINSLSALILFGGLLFKKPLLRYIFDSTLTLDDLGWKKLTCNWALFFLFLAFLNEVIWRNFSNDFWANFKVFGVMPITILFTLTQIPIIVKHSKGGLLTETERSDS